MTTTSYSDDCACCGKEIHIEMDGGYLWEGSFACEECIEEMD
tara:strand:+ start:237 stop:362 length:126 start_codon:yes stop_codon:yes gene_type:complete